MAAATAAAAVMGFVAAKDVQEQSVAVNAQVNPEVELAVENAQAVTDDLRLGQEIVFHKGDVEVVFCRSIRYKQFFTRILQTTDEEVFLRLPAPVETKDLAGQQQHTQEGQGAG